MTTTPNPLYGSETVDSLAGRIKAKYPDYSNVENGELVHRIVQKYPEYQNHLSTDELQRLTRESTPNPTNSVAENFNVSATGARNFPELWGNVKAGARKLLNEGPISTASDFIQGLSDSTKEAVGRYPDNDARRYLSAVPAVGPRLADAYTSVKKSHPFDALANVMGLGAGAKIASEAPAKISRATTYTADAASNPARTYANVRDALHPAPQVPPGLSPQATANLTSKTARLGTEDLFRASAPTGSNPGFRERLSIATPDIAEIQRQTPLQTSGGFVNPDFRVREFVKNADAHLDNLWNQERMPQIQRN